MNTELKNDPELLTFVKYLITDNAIGGDFVEIKEYLTNAGLNAISNTYFKSRPAKIAYTSIKLGRTAESIPPNHLIQALGRGKDYFDLKKVRVLYSSLSDSQREKIAAVIDNVQNSGFQVNLLGDSDVKAVITNVYEREKSPIPERQVEPEPEPQQPPVEEPESPTPTVEQGDIKTGDILDQVANQGEQAAVSGIINTIQTEVLRILPELVSQGLGLQQIQTDVAAIANGRARAAGFTKKLALQLIGNAITEFVKLMFVWYGNKEKEPQEEKDKIPPLIQVDPTPAPTDPPTDPPIVKPIPKPPVKAVAAPTPTQTDEVRQEPLIVQVQPGPLIIKRAKSSDKFSYQKETELFTESDRDDLRFIRNYINYDLETRQTFGRFTKSNKDLYKRIAGTNTPIVATPNYVAFNPTVESFGRNFVNDPHQSSTGAFSNDNDLAINTFNNFQV